MGVAQATLEVAGGPVFVATAPYSRSEALFSLIPGLVLDVSRQADEALGSSPDRLGFRLTVEHAPA